MIPESVELQAKALEAKAEELRHRAEWGDDYEFRKIAADLVTAWCEDAEMWATHGCPGPAKLDRIEIDVANAIKAQKEQGK